MAETYYTAAEVNAMMERQRNELIEYINKQIILGTTTPDPSETSLYLQVTKTDNN